MKKILVVLSLLVFLAGFSAAYELQKQEFSIQVDNKGIGLIIEKYYFKFENSQDTANFITAVKNNGQNLLSWKAFDDRISPYFESIEKLNLQGFSFDPKTNILELKYISDTPVAEKSFEDSRSEEWRLRPGLLQSFEQGTLVIVPKSITISITLPSNADLKAGNIPPTVQFTKNTLLLNNARINNLNIQYAIPKPIAQTEIFSQFFQWLKDTGLIYAIIAVLIALGVIAAVKRKELAERIENYIVKNSEISSKEDFEEIEIDD